MSIETLKKALEAKCGDFIYKTPLIGYIVNMAQSIAEFLFELFHSEYAVVFLISIIPMIEVRGAIPIGVSLGMNIWVSYVFAVLSALVICPILIFFLKPVLNWLKKTKIFKKLANAFIDLFTEKAEKIKVDSEALSDDDKKEARKKRLKKLIGVFLFVAIPLPMTGVWTGTAVGVFLDQKWYDTLISVVAGNFVAGAIITALSAILDGIMIGSMNALDLILYVLFGFVVITLISLVAGMYLRKKKKDKKEQSALNEEK